MRDGRHDENHMTTIIDMDEYLYLLSFSST